VGRVGMSALVQANRLVKRFTDTQEPAVRGIDLVIERGEFVAIMGPSGSGKSTLVNMVAGLDRPTEGEVWFNGARIDLMSEAALAKLRRRRVGVVFQFFNLLPTLSAAENVELPMRLIGHGRSRSRKESEGSWLILGWQARKTPHPGTFRVVSSNAWPLPARSRTHPICLSRTSRRAISTRWQLATF
jgi:ABC-type lipoprotein export system ATPase subunit